MEEMNEMDGRGGTEGIRSDYDVVIVGARVAGASLAWELGRAGYRVLLADKSRFPSDVLSTHNFFNNSVGMLREMGVLDRLLATGTPTYRRAYLRLEDEEIDGFFPEANGETECLCVRRTHLDRILFEHAASMPGVDARPNFRITGLLRSGGAVAGVEGTDSEGKPVRIPARLVVGADGRRSIVRELAGSRRIVSVPTDFASYVGYFEGFRQEGERCTEFYRIGETLAIAFPTSDDLHVIGLMFPLEWKDALARMKENPEAGFREFVARGLGATSFPSRLKEAKRSGPIRGLLGYDNDWHEAMGPGWALAGDALSFKDPAVGQGMHDALLGARLLRRILSSEPDWESRWDDMARRYEQELNDHFMPLFRMACGMTRNVPLRPEQAAVNRLIGRHPEATSAFLGLYNHSRTPEELERIVGGLLRQEPQIDSGEG